METLSAGLPAELRTDKIRVSVLRSGRLAESGFNRDWPEARRARYRGVVLKAGYYALSGEPISPQITAQAIIDLVRLPRGETNTAIVGREPAVTGSKFLVRLLRRTGALGK